MEEEKFVTGYCRQLDAPRTVEVLLENGHITEADCCYGSCIYESSCPLAKEMDQWK